MPNFRWQGLQLYTLTIAKYSNSMVEDTPKYKQATYRYGIGE